MTYEYDKSQSHDIPFLSKKFLLVPVHNIFWWYYNIKSTSICEINKEGKIKLEQPTLQVKIKTSKHYVLIWRWFIDFKSDAMTQLKSEPHFVACAYITKVILLPYLEIKSMLHSKFTFMSKFYDEFTTNAARNSSTVATSPVTFSLLSTSFITLPELQCKQEIIHS